MRKRKLRNKTKQTLWVKSKGLYACFRNSQIEEKLGNLGRGKQVNDWGKERWTQIKDDFMTGTCNVGLGISLAKSPSLESFTFASPSDIAHGSLQNRAFWLFIIFHFMPYFIPFYMFLFHTVQSHFPNKIIGSWGQFPLTLLSASQGRQDRHWVSTHTYYIDWKPITRLCYKSSTRNVNSGRTSNSNLGSSSLVLYSVLHT